MLKLAESSVVIILGLAVNVASAQGPNLYVWAGGDTPGATMTVSINQNIMVPIWCQSGDPTVWLGNLSYPLGVKRAVIDAFDSALCVTHYPFSQWDAAGFLNSNDDGHPTNPNPPGYHSLTMLGLSRISPGSTAPFFYSAVPVNGFEFNVHTANDPSLNGQTVQDAFIAGHDPVTDTANCGDTLGIDSFDIIEEFSPLFFGGGGALTGTVTDTESQPISGVTVDVLGTPLSGFTDSQGAYFLDDVPVGTRNISFSHPNFVETTLPANISLNDTTVLDVTLILRGFGAIAGTITDSLGAPIEGVSITVTGTSANGVSDIGGSFLLDDIPSGGHDISFAHSRYSDTSMSVVVIANETTYVSLVMSYWQPSEVTLLQNYPNPFSSVTTIEFYLPEPAYVVVEVFDSIGRRIETVAAMQGSAGLNRVEWNAAGRPSGTYFFQVSTAKASVTKAMMLLRK